MKLVKFISGYCYLLICMYSVMYPVAAIAEEPLEVAIKDTVAGNEEARQAQVQIEKSFATQLLSPGPYRDFIADKTKEEDEP